MVHFLKNDKNRTIIECEVYDDDLDSSANIEEYSKMLLDLHRKDLHLVFIQAISDLDEIRGWWWEQGKESDDYESIDDFVKEKFLSVAKKFKLNYVTD